MLLQSEKIQKPNFLKEWLIDMEKKKIILKGYLSAYSSVGKLFLLTVEKKSQKKFDFNTIYIIIFL